MENVDCRLNRGNNKRNLYERICSTLSWKAMIGEIDTKKL